jgi:hypothetical protein
MKIMFLEWEYFAEVLVNYNNKFKLCIEALDEDS